MAPSARWLTAVISLSLFCYTALGFSSNGQRFTVLPDKRQTQDLVWNPKFSGLVLFPPDRFIGDMGRTFSFRAR